MARHSQQVVPRNLTCTNCKNGACSVCVDVLLLAAGSNPVCTCRREDHFKGIDEGSEKWNREAP